MRKTFSTFLGAILLTAGIGVALAANDANSRQIYDALRAGQVAQAEQMVDQVLRDYPRSARAHYVAAEVYARAGNLATARRELDSARSLAPGLPFVQPSSVRELEAQLNGSPMRGPAFAVPVRRPSVPWGLIIVLICGVAIVWMLFRRRSTNYYPAGYSGAPGTGPAAGGGYGGPYPYGPGGAPYGGGSGILGSLGTGLAVGAGVAAGEELVRHAIDGRSGGEFIPPANAGEAPLPPPNEDMGGQDFGLTGGDSWDDNSGGGFDAGGGGGDDWT
ncbi:MAG TPA: tetratricopeptide repeat protein [Steroidobacteraceae bacterium]|nr:tetratricopeptide repeat protein [Steroidobacteraceae bacterium]